MMRQVRGIRRLCATAPALRETALHGLHVESGGKMVDFSGWSMPVQYSDVGIAASVGHTRTASSLFDVSHMLQLRIEGEGRVPFLESLVVSDIAELAPNCGRYTLLTNEGGGVVDDACVANMGDHLRVVVNAGCAQKDLEHLQDQLSRWNGPDASLVVMDQHSLIALQGPQSASILAKLSQLDSLDDVGFFEARDLLVAGIPVSATRCGYTGEDGFELSVATENADKLARVLLEDTQVQLAGLGARDCLRLEAGLSLYGHDLDETITPVEARLNWTISKSRRARADFLGADVILKQLKEGTKVKRVGFVIEKGAPAREHAEVHSEDGTVLGAVCSGTFSPTLKKAIGMAYVTTGYSKKGTALQCIGLRGKASNAVVTPMPFVKTRYHIKK